MASVSGSKLAFFEIGQPGTVVNLGLTTNGSVVPAPSTVAGAFNIEVFTASVPSGFTAPATGYQAAAFIQGAVAIPGDNNELLAGSLGSTEQLLAGTYSVIDRTGAESIQIVGNAAGPIVVVGSNLDTITGSANAAQSQTMEANSGAGNADAVPGPITLIGGAGATGMILGANDSVVGGAGATIVDGHPSVGGGATDTIVGGAGAMTVYGAAADSVVGGAGALVLNENQGHSGLERIAGGAGNLSVTDIGKADVITGSTVGTTSIDDTYGSGGNSLITGGSGTTGTLAVGENTFIKGAGGDTITGGTDLTYIDDSKGGKDSIVGGSGTVAGAVAGQANVNTAIVGGKGDAIIGGAGATFIDGSAGSMAITGGAGSTTVAAGGGGDKITGGAGFMQVNDALFGGTLSVTGGAGNLDVFDIGKGNTISGSTTGWSVINDSYDTTAGAGSSITGGSGVSTIPGVFGGDRGQQLHHRRCRRYDHRRQREHVRRRRRFGFDYRR